MHVCLVNQAGKILVHQNLPTEPERFLAAIGPYRQQDWSSASNACSPGTGWPISAPEQNIAFVLGHALYMKAIHGGKAKNDKIDSQKIALLLRGGMLPMAYVYPHAMRATRDLLRRRMHLVHAPGRSPGPHPEHRQPVQPAAADARSSPTPPIAQGSPSSSPTPVPAGVSRPTWR